ncbi:MAG TPA: hypothetical protein VF691_09280 [Cytophagaceae bacterium]|jgi:hypothetical protein
MVLSTAALFFISTNTYSQRIKITGKVFLEGPFDESKSAMVANLKMDSLVANGLVPGAPINLAVPTTITRGYNAVDAVKLCLLRGDYSRYDSVYAWLAEDGFLYDIYTGTSKTIAFNSAPEGNYYLEIRHRNHLAIMYTTFLSLKFTTTLFFDFTNISNIYRNGAIMVNANSCAMIGGNASGDQKGEVNASDLYEVSKDGDNLRTGYLLTDVDMNGVVNALDRQLTLEHNLKLYNSKVP